ncbi:MAG: hypothetical protein KatS3mg095_0220 [Candidatus Parcubacteria bacterium]|nr:MAG: hypothetical protein KatS3mg095_0220 [Candidatus Parcubacteria bacterium]
MFNIFGSNKILGIDLGSRSIKIVEVEKYKKSFILNNYIIIELEETEKFSSLLETSQLYEENLAKILENGLKEFKTKKAVYSIPSLYYFYTNFSLPYIPLNSLKNAINFEYQKYLPVSYEKFHIEWRNIKYTPFNLEGQDKWFIFFTAIPESYLNKIKNISSLNKINFQKAYAEFFSLEVFFKESKDNIILIDIGYSYSFALLIKEGQVIHCQKLKFTLRDILNTLARVMSVGINEAENIFIRKGFNILPEEIDLKKIFDEVLDNFSFDILKLKENLENSFNLKINLIYFKGGLTLAKGFLESLSSRLTDVQINIFNPFDTFIMANENIKNKDVGNILSQAIGSCVKYFLG